MRAAQSWSENLKERLSCLSQQVLSTLPVGFFFFANLHAIVCLFQEAASPCVRSRDGHAPGPSERAGVPTAGSTATSKEPRLSLPSQATQEQGRVAVGREQEKGEQCVQQVHSFWLPLSRWPVSARVGQELGQVPVAWKQWRERGTGVLLLLPSQCPWQTLLVKPEVSFIRIPLLPPTESTRCLGLLRSSCQHWPGTGGPVCMGTSLPEAEGGALGDVTWTGQGHGTGPEGFSAWR